jgi:outer membrane protein assembly factor BamB
MLKSFSTEKGERKLNFGKNKIAFLLIALFLMTTITVIAPLPMVNAATKNFYTWVYVADGAGGCGVGVGEDIILVAWTADMPPDIGEQSGVVESPSGRAGWYDMQIKVWDPDGEEEVLDMPYSDPVGANWIMYTPDKVGTYEIQAIFPYTDKELKTVYYDYAAGIVYMPGDHIIYSAAESPIDTFEVTEDPREPWPEAPLPNDYWTRPISDASREWYVLQGNWLGGAANQWPQGGAGGTIGGATGFGGNTYAYGNGPESAHILWSKPFYIGGLMDERFGDINFATAHYQGVQFSPSIILDGKIHWSPYYTHAGSEGWEIIDLYTGETLFRDYDATCPNSGSVYLYESPNQHGGFAYLWETGGGGFFMGGGATVEVPEIITLSQSYQSQAGMLPTQTGNYYTVNRTETPVSLGTVWKMIDGYTMHTLCYIANVSSSGTQVYGKDGSIVYYSLQNYNVTNTDINYYCRVWNASAGTMVSSQTGTGAWQWRPAGGTFGGSNAYFGGTTYNIVHDGSQMWWQNFSIPDVSGGSIQAIREGELMIVGDIGVNTPEEKRDGWMMGISLEEDDKGTQLWKTDFTIPFCDTSKNITVAGMFTGGFSLRGVYPEEGIMVFGESKQLKVWVYDLYEGKLLWETEEDEIPQYWFYSDSVAIHHGKLLIYGGYAGTMMAYNATTGEKLWTYNAENIGEESPYGNYPIDISAITEDKVYFMAWEHSYTHPIIRGPCLRCVNLTDGTEIWSILDFGTGGALADGILLSSNSQDNMIYAYGRGPSATTVAASPSVSVHGTSVMITGTVTDQTASGRRNTNDLVDFTLKGTPAISDEDMSAWMEYMFMQQGKPADAEGVEVILETLDPNGNFYEIGRTTSDVNGNYGLMWEPEVPGEYQIFARFEGSASYGPSSASTYLGVEDAPQPTPTPTPSPAPMTDAYVIGFGSAALVAIIVIGVILILLRRR